MEISLDEFFKEVQRLLAEPCEEYPGLAVEFSAYDTGYSDIYQLSYSGTFACYFMTGWSSTLRNTVGVAATGIEIGLGMRCANSRVKAPHIRYAFFDQLPKAICLDFKSFVINPWGQLDLVAHGWSSFLTSYLRNIKTREDFLSFLVGLGPHLDRFDIGALGVLSDSSIDHLAFDEFIRIKKNFAAAKRMI